MKVGDKLKARWDENITDHVTKDKIYKITKVINYEPLGITHFWIVNDLGKECFPISTSFTKIN